MDPKDVVELYDKGMSLLASIKRLSKSILVNVKHYRTSSVVTLDRAVEDYYSGATGLGSLVTIEGVISPYMMSARPRFDFDSMMKMSGSKVTPALFPGDVEVGIGMMSYPGQYPIQTIPPIEIDGKRNYIYFLYPPDLKTLRVEQYVGSRSKEELVDRTQKPLIVISHQDLYSELNKVVKLTGALVQADSSVVDSLCEGFVSAHQTILTNSLKPFTEGRTSLCLDLRKEFKMDVDNLSRTIPATIYIETHFENILKIPNYQKFMGASLPGGAELFHWSSNSENGPYWGMSSTDTSVCTQDYESYGFFTDVRLNDKKEFESKMALFHGFIGVFRKTIQNKARREYGVEIKQRIDFVFDFNRARAFHPDGVMVSKKVEDALRENANLADGVEWVRRT